MRLRTMAGAALLTLALAACAPAAGPAPTAPPLPPTVAPATASPSALRAPSPATRPAASPSPAAAPSAAPLPVVDRGPVAAGEIGSPQRPLVLVNVPFMDTQRLTKGMELIGKRLEEETGLVYRTSVPTSYAAVVEALCANQADAAFLSPLPYVLAHQKCGADMVLVSVVRGQVSYRGQIVTRADSPIRGLADLKGKRFAWTDPSSTSGYLYPRATLIEAGLNPDRDFAQQVFAGGHDKVIAAVLNGQVDAGATYEEAESAAGVLATFPDAVQRLRPIAKTADIPNDGVAVRKDLPPAIARRVRDGLLRVSGSPDGDKTFFDAMGTNGVMPTSDAAYEPVRRAARALGLDLEEEIRKQG